MTMKNELHYSRDGQRIWRKRMKDLTFGQTVRSYRLAEDWTLTDAAEKIGISKQQLSDYETGRKLPSIEKAYQIASFERRKFLFR
jgi:transcriptional regulator with XRE-family HTH domain